MIHETMVQFGVAIGLFILASALAAPVTAQPAPRQPTPNDTLKSPEVLPDHRVIFRIYAPKASEVTISGDWITQGRGTGGKLEKDTQGVWSITVGPLVPDLYAYNFTVDGVRTIDPKNPMIKPGISSVDNMFEVSGEEAAFEENRPVPHGEIRVAWYHSSTLDAMRSLRVYTPPGYDDSTARYPVFYLLHGGGDDDAGWSTIGRAGFIMDNLLAEQKVRPMIVVMPNGSMPRPASAARFVPGSGPPPERMQAQNRFTEELLQNVMPYAEQHYRVLADRENRAIAGLSMGGGQTLTLAFSKPELFRYVAAMSAAANGITEARYPAIFKDPSVVNKQFKVLWIGIGKDDRLTGPSNTTLHEALTKAGITHTYALGEGRHEWTVWRNHLHDVAPLMFK